MGRTMGSPAGVPSRWRQSTEVKEHILLLVLRWLRGKLRLVEQVWGSWLWHRREAPLMPLERTVWSATEVCHSGRC